MYAVFGYSKLYYLLISNFHPKQKQISVVQIEINF
jgi:hypothetical protein